MKINPYILIYIGTAFLTAVSQILLKVSANKKHAGSKEYLNPYVIVSYLIFLGVTALNLYASRGIELKLIAVLANTSYIFVMGLSLLLLKEKITRKKAVGTLIVLVGMVVYSIF